MLKSVLYRILLNYEYKYICLFKAIIVIFGAELYIPFINRQCRHKSQNYDDFLHNLVEKIVHLIYFIPSFNARVKEN